ncbi:threonine aldolase family protein [Rubrivirga marina]|uniref:Low specificity L-threonine aldolase n=1 Tax=Rubrivirga marina TaxID=1196024 RepID=A0A271J3S4_9BACT|nr:GntG family PLP-dependent aldolase [Rubrivirga marina]PAP78181.1 low specificity L-threonine aldolase [Rubrivirga marina]
MVDLRSDTVTRPTSAMRRAMAEAEVGDDVFGEDPTVKRLEARVAEMLGKEAALFVPSGVMGNQIAIRVHTRPADEVVVAERSHIYHYEGAAPAALWGVQLRPVGDLSGVLTVPDVEAVVQGAHDWEARTRLVCLENTINKAGGVAVPLDAITPVAEAARAHGLALHLDGARLWNAAVALCETPAALSAPFDTVNVCLSKGLGAPVGSVLAGPADLVREARRVRKLLGGGMRQVGVLAAAALVALDDFERDDHALVRADHARARRLADVIEDVGLALVQPPDTNIVLFETPEPASEAVAGLEAAGVRTVAFGPHAVRAILHRDVDAAAVEQAAGAIRQRYPR